MCNSAENISVVKYAVVFHKTRLRVSCFFSRIIHFLISTIYPKSKPFFSLFSTLTNETDWLTSSTPSVAMELTNWLMELMSDLRGSDFQNLNQEMFLLPFVPLLLTYLCEGSRCDVPGAMQNMWVLFSEVCSFDIPSCTRKPELPRDPATTVPALDRC